MYPISFILRFFLFFLFLSIYINNIVYSFLDISKNYHYYIPISYLKENNVVEGYSDGTFKPENNINRAEFVKMMVVVLNIDNVSDNKHCFNDVKDEWYAKYICFAKEKGWVNGYPDGFFRPANNINKVEAIKILLESSGLMKYQSQQKKFFLDTDENSWYIKYVNTAKQLGILEELNMYYPAKLVNRGSISENIFRVSVIKNLNIPYFDNSIRDIIAKNNLFKIVDLKNNNDIKNIVNKLDVDMSIVEVINKSNLAYIFDKPINEINFNILNSVDIDQIFIDRLNKKNDILFLLNSRYTPTSAKLRWDLIQKYKDDIDIILTYIKNCKDVDVVLKDIYSIHKIYGVDQSIFESLKKNGYIKDVQNNVVSFDAYKNYIKTSGYNVSDNEFINLFNNPNDLISVYTTSNELVIGKNIENFLKKYKPSQDAIDLVYVKIFTYDEVYKYIVNNKPILYTLLEIFYKHNLIFSQNISYILGEIILSQENIDVKNKSLIFNLLSRFINNDIKEKLADSFLQSEKIILYYPQLNKYYHEILFDIFNNAGIKFSDKNINNFLSYLYKTPKIQNYVLQDGKTPLIDGIINFFYNKGYRFDVNIINEIYIGVFSDINNIIRFDSDNNLLGIRAVQVFIDKNIKPSDIVLNNLFESIYTNKDFIKYIDKNSAPVLLNLYNNLFKKIGFIPQQNIFNNVFIGLMSNDELYFKHVNDIVKTINIKVDGTVLSLLNNTKQIFNSYINQNWIFTSVLDKYNYIKQNESKNALDYINKIRSNYNIQRVELHTDLTNAISKHCKYVNAHPNIEGLDKHNEVNNGSIYFGGENLLKRIENIGIKYNDYSINIKDISLKPEFAEVLLFDSIEGIESVNKWISTVYHRYPLLHPYAAYIGYAFEADINTGLLCTGINSMNVYNKQQNNIVDNVIVYPWNNMQNVPISWDRRTEIPDPYPHANNYIVGSVITVQKYVQYNSYNDYINDKFIIKNVDLYDNINNTKVDIYVDKDNNYNKETGYIGAKEQVGISSVYPLQKNRQYKIVVNYNDIYGIDKVYVSYFTTGNE